MKEEKHKLYKRIVITLLVMVILLAFSGILSKMITYIEEQSCRNTLISSMDEISSEIVSDIKSDQELLESIANIIAGQSSVDSPETMQIINGFQPNTMMAHIALLLPGDKVMLPDAPDTDCGGLLSFEKEAALGKHISDRSVDIRDKNRPILRNFVPVQKDGKTVAMLYSVVDLKAFSGHIFDTVYGDRAAIYVIDGNTGEFLVDTWHNTLGNLNDLGKRAVKKGYSQERMQKDAREGKSGHCVFVSKSAGDYMHFYYSPIPINNWSVGISVTEGVAFAKAKKVKRILFGFIFLELAVLTAYFIYILRSVRKELHEKQWLAERDILTGTFNRNSFERHIGQFSGQCNTSLTCAFIDANGLHELNNTKGHAAGDEMLKAVASALHDFFDDRDIYRIGGDEFVVLVRDTEEEDTRRKCENISASLAEMGYHVSIGIYQQNLPIDTDSLMEQAGRIMLENKRRFYSQNNSDRRERT